MEETDKNKPEKRELTALELLVVRALDNGNMRSQVRREIAKGFSKHTEHYAYPHVMPLAQGKWNEERLLRIGGLIALSSVSHNGEVSFGTWCANSRVNGIEERLMRIVNLPFGPTVDEVLRILTLVGTSNGGFNWYRLAEVLYWWGDGFSEKSIDTRQSILREFFRIDQRADENNDSSTEEKEQDNNE